jgi:hypothetical protein
MIRLKDFCFAPYFVVLWAHQHEYQCQTFDIEEMTEWPYNHFKEQQAVNRITRKSFTSSISTKLLIRLENARNLITKRLKWYDTGRNCMKLVSLVARSIPFMLSLESSRASQTNLDDTVLSTTTICLPDLAMIEDYIVKRTTRTYIH